MNTIIKIIEKKGGLQKLEEVGHFKVQVEGYMALSIDFLGKGPNGLPMFAVAHNYIQDGDVMADPDMQVEVGPDNKLYPVTYQQDGLGLFQQVYVYGSNGLEGKPTGIRLGLRKQLNSFLRTWGANLRRQGFLAAA